MPTPNIGVVAGLGNTGIVNQSQLIRDVDPVMYYLEAFKYPLATILFTEGTYFEKSAGDKFALKGSPTRIVATINPKFEHTENELIKFAFSPTVAVATGDASITISTSDDDYFVAGDQVLLTNASGGREIARVTAVGSGSLTVTRNVGSTGAIAMTTADQLYKMGVTREEDSTSTSPRQQKGETVYNYVQFISEPYGNTWIDQATANYNGDQYKRNKMEAFGRMKRNLEMIAWFGTRAILNSTTNPVYQNGGILYWLESQFTDVPVLDVGGVLTKQTWDQWLQDALKYNSAEKFVFCSSPVLTAVSGFASTQLRPADVDLNKFGMAITEYQSPFGNVKLVREPLFDEVTVANGMAVCLDLTRVKFRPLVGNGVDGKLKSHDDIQENDRSGRKGEWIVIGGWDIETGKAHAILKNVQA